MEANNPAKPGVTWNIIHNDLIKPRTIKSHLHRDLLPKQLLAKKAKVSRKNYFLLILDLILNYFFLFKSLKLNYHKGIFYCKNVLV